MAKVAQKDAKLQLDEQSKEYWRWRDNILTYEELMLETLTFDLSVENPLVQLREQFKTLRLNHHEALRDSAWAFCNDACLTVLPLLLSAKDIAIGAIFFALTVLKTQIEDINGRPWWEVINGTEENIALAVNTVSDFYRENPIRKKDPNMPASPKFDLGGTRKMASASQNGTPTPVSPQRRTNGNGVSQNESNSTTGPVGKEANSTTVVVVKQEDEGERATTEQPQASVETTVEVSSQQSRGDSDAALKAAANDLSIHDHKAESGGGLVSPPRFSKRKSAELEEGGEREPKKLKLEEEEEEEEGGGGDDEDEGEIKGS